MDKDSILKDIQSMADQGAEPEEIKGYISSLGKNPDDYIQVPIQDSNTANTGFIKGLSNLLSSKKIGDTSSATKADRLSALLKGIGGVSPTIEGAFSNPKGALSAIVETAPMLATGGESIPAQMAVQGAATGLSGIARDLLGGKDLKGALTEGGEEGSVASALTGGLGLAGKFAKPIVKGLGRGLAAISPIPEEKIFEAVSRPKDIFKKGWTKAESKIDELSDILSSNVNDIKSAIDSEKENISKKALDFKNQKIIKNQEIDSVNKNIKSQSDALNAESQRVYKDKQQKALSEYQNEVNRIKNKNLDIKEKNKLIAEQAKKTAVDLSNQAGIAANNAMKEIESNSGALVGSARRGLKEGAKESTLYGDDMAKEVDSIIKEGTIIDPSGETYYASPSEMSFLKEIKKELLGGIERGESKSSVLDPIFGPMITTKETMQRAPISPARISTIIGKIDNFVTYGPKYSSDVVTTEGEFLLKKARNALNENLRKLSPEIAHANDNSFLVKEIKSSLQSRTDKSVGGLIRDYHKGNIFPRQKEALEKLQDVSGVDFLKSSYPEPVDITKSLPINVKKPVISQPEKVIPMKIPYHNTPEPSLDIPPELQSKQDLIDSLSKLSSQRGARSMMQSFSKVTPEESQKIQSLLGDEGASILSQLKDLDIAKDFIRKRPSVYGAMGAAGPALALGNVSKPLAVGTGIAAMAATSPRVNSYVIRSLPYTKAGVKLIGKGAKAAVPLVSRSADGSMSSKIYDEYQKIRRNK